MLAAGAVSLLPEWARQPLRLPRLPVTESLLVRPGRPRHGPHDPLGHRPSAGPAHTP